MSTITADKSIKIFINNESTSIPSETYRIVLEKGQDGWIVVTCPDIPGIVTQGKTEKEAIQNANEAIELMLEDSRNKEYNVIVISHL